MPKAINRTVKYSDVATINALRVYMQRRREATFDEIRIGVLLLSTASDGELRQAVQDSDMETQEDQ